MPSSTPPPPKRPRVLAPESAEDYIEKLESNTKYNKKYKTTQSDSRFQIIDLPADPEGLLAGCFQACIDAAIDDSRSNGVDPDLLGCTIHSHLLEKDIFTPFRPVTTNTVDLILNMFLKVAQSKAQLGITLWGEPFNVKVSTIAAKELPKDSEIIGGGRRQRKLAPVHHHIKKKALIELEPRRDGYCLFRALQATFVHKIRGYDFRTFYNYRVGRFGMRGQLDKETKELMRAIGAPMNLKEYDARIYVPLVVDYWNQKFEGSHRFKVFIFGALGYFVPMYKYPQGENDYDTALLLYYDAKHFQGIRTCHGMFDKPYCLSCQSTYDKESNHTVNCRYILSIKALKSFILELVVENVHKPDRAILASHPAILKRNANFATSYSPTEAAFSIIGIQDSAINQNSAKIVAPSGAWN